MAPDLVLMAANCASTPSPPTSASLQAFNGIKVGKSNLANEGRIEVDKSNLANEGVEFDPCGPDTYHLHYKKLVTDASREAYDGVAYEHDLMLI